MTALHIDFETRSVVELPETGAHLYSRHPTTDIWCMAYAFGDGPIKLWTPDDLFPDPEVQAHVENGGQVVGHNVAFERLIWREIMVPRYGWHPLRDDQLRCTLIECYNMNLPGSLENAAGALGLEIQKDAAGRRLMLQMAKPRNAQALKDGREKEPRWWDDSARKARLFAYCRNDVAVEREIDKRVLRLTDREYRYWQMDLRRNDRGVYVDEALCEAAKKLAARATKKLNAQMAEATQGAVTACSNVGQLAEWLRRHGIETESVAKEVLEDLLIRDDLPANVTRAVELRLDAAKTSVSKINAMLAGRQEDGRLRGIIQFLGASQTRRDAGRRVQPQNFVRPTIKKVDPIIDLILQENLEALDMLYGDPMQQIANALRSMFTADARQEFFDADFSNIEGRVIAWLARDRRKLQRFRDYDTVVGHDEKGQPTRRGPDVYLVAAAQIYNCTPEQAAPHRQVGKVSELALGFGGGVGAYAKMAKNYGVRIADAYATVWGAALPENREKALEAYGSRGKKSGMAREAWLAAELIKLGWRDGHPDIVQLWRDLEDAAIAAVGSPGKTFTVGGMVSYKMAGSFLFCRGPSGAFICYPYPRLIEKKTPWGSTQVGVVFKTADQGKGKNHWGDKDFYGGLAAENVTQFVAREALKAAEARLEAAGYDIVLPVHDEILAEVGHNHGNLDHFMSVMAEKEPWMQGLPIAVDGWAGQRYRK